MIQELVQNWETNKHLLRERLSKEHPGSYSTLVKMVVETVTSQEEYSEFSLDPERIHEINDGDYQGTLLYVIAAKGYQPYDYWYVKVSYGSCSGCDTLQAISDYDYNEIPSEEQVAQYMTLALHIVQGIKKTAGWGE